MNKLTLWTGSKKEVIKLPSNFEELSRAQLKKVIRAKTEFETFKAVLNLKWFQIPTLIKLKKLSVSDLFKIKMLIGFVSEADAKFETNKFTAVRLGFWRRKYKAPAKFGALSFGDFISADTFFSHYVKTENADYLIEFFYSIYKGRKPAPQPPAWLCMLLLKWYAYNRAQITKRYKYVFAQSKTAGLGTEDFGWAGILNDIAISITELDKIAELPVHNVLFSLNKKCHDYQKQEAESKAKKII